MVEQTARWLQLIAGGLIITLLAAQIVVVALRYVFSYGWPWSLDLMVYLFLLSVTLPSFAVLLKNINVRVDVFYSTWPFKRQRVADRLALAFLFAPAMGYAAYASLGTTLRSWQVLESSPTYGGLPGYFLLKTALTLTFGLLAILALGQACRTSPYSASKSSVEGETA